MLFPTTYDLKLDGLAIELDGANLEVDADGGDVGLGVGVVGKSEEKARLSDTGVTDEEELEEVVVSESVVVLVIVSHCSHFSGLPRSLVCAGRARWQRAVHPGCPGRCGVVGPRSFPVKLVGPIRVGADSVLSALRLLDCR